MQAAIAELNFRPNVLARGLKGKRTRVIALLLPEPNKAMTRIHMEFIISAAEAASQASCGLLLWTSPDEDREILHLAQEGLVEGLILMEIRMDDPRVQMLVENGFQFSMIGHCRRNDGISYVDFDFRQAIRLAVQHLVDLGHREVALFNFSRAAVEMEFGPAVRGLQAFREAIRDHGIRGVVRACEHDVASSQQMIQAVLAENSSLSAAIVFDEQVCFGVIRGLLAKGVRVPEDFSLVGVITPRIAEMTVPPLTSVDFPADEMGRIGIRLLVEQLEHEPSGPTQILLAPSLTVRQSSGPHRGT